VRIPSLLEYDLAMDSTGSQLGELITLPAPFSSFNELWLDAKIRGTTDAEAEHSFAKELGYRYTGDDWNLDLSLFHTNADNVLVSSVDYYPQDALQQLQAASSAAEALAVIQNTRLIYQLGYSAELESYGGEAVIGWQVADNIKTEIGYSHTTYDYSLAPGTISAVGFSSDLQQIFLKGSAQLNNENTLYAVFRVEDGEAYNTDDFTSLDLSWNWQITPDYSFSLTGNNLLYGSHLEYANTSESYTIPTYIEQSVVARIKAEF
jgi:iron complex outermembrane receptor protein